jgi:hypothetical protein
MPQNFRCFVLSGWLPLLAFAVSGCSLEKMTGDTLSTYAANHMVPYMMASDDVNVACETGAAMGSFLMSFERVTTPPDRAALVTQLAAGMCAEAHGWESELRRLRAAHDGRAAEAQDALSEEKQAHALAAHRFYDAYRRVGAFSGPVGQGKCPNLSEDDQLFYILGLSAGVLAVMHDKAADGSAGVPTDIPAAVTRASECVVSYRWWGVPGALQAAIWVAAPPLKPAEKDPWATLTDAVNAGESAKVRLSAAFEVQADVTAGRRDEAKKAIAAFAAAEQASAPDPKWRLLDAYGASMILHESDKIWTEDTGHRTPFGQLGTFHGAAAPPPPESDPFKE